MATGARSAGGFADGPWGERTEDRPAPFEGRFVGRADELRRIVAACTAAQWGRGTLTVVTGEAGIGKTRLCQEVVTGARAAGCTGIMARCWGDGGAPAFWPWQPVLDELCGYETAGLLGAGTEPPGGERDRFARFAAVTRELGAACARSHAVLVIDDIHAADMDTLLLMRFVARALDDMRLALVLGRRAGEPAEDTPERRLLDEIEREAMLVALRRFGKQETAEFLALHGMGDLREGTVDVVTRITDGHPLFLRRVALSGADDLPQGRGSRAAASTSRGLRVAITQAFSQLSGDALQTLRMSAVLGEAPSINQVAAVAQVAVPTVLDAVQQASAAGLVVAEQPGRFTFSHELVRTALEEMLGPAERLDAHARAAAATRGLPLADPDARTPSSQAGLETWAASSSPEELVRCAHHALAAAPRSLADARFAVAACRTAAQSLTNNFAYEQADRLLTAATELHEPSSLGPPSGELLLEWAQGALSSGRLTEARARFARAVTVVEQAKDPVLLAEAALGLGGYWLTESRPLAERARVQALQRAALSALPLEQSALRARLTARLAAEDFYNGGPIEPVHEALDAARRCGDLVALADALSLCHHALFVPEHVHTRLALAEELVQVGAAAGHGVLGLMGLCWRTIDLFHLGDPHERRALEDLRQRADALACQVVLYVVSLIDVTLATRAGQLDLAMEMARGCLEQGETAGDADAFAYYGGQVAVIRWLQGRSQEVVELMDGIATSPQLHESDFAYRAAGAAFAGEAGQTERAREVLDQLMARGLSSLPRSSSWLAGVMAIAELAATLGDQRAARETYELLHPFSELPVVASLGICCFGSTHWPLGVAALTFGDVPLAVEHLEQAVAANRRLGNRPMTVIAQADLARALEASPSPENRTRAVSLLSEAVDRAETMGMTERAARWRSYLDELRSRPDAASVATTADGRPSPHRPGPSTRPGAAGLKADQACIRREGSGWIVELGERHVPVGNLVGMGYLADLLTHPGQPISALALASGYRVVADAADQELLDHDARAAYAARARDLVGELAEAEANADIGRVETLRAELDALVDQLQEATGLAGRARTFTGPSERARTAVRKAIMRAITAIETGDREIGGLLRSSISTGRTCVYTPDPVRPIGWSAAR